MLVVEHDEQTIRAADHLVALGPGAGEHGGRIIAEGTAAEVEKVPESLTGQFLAGTRTIPVPEKRRTPTGYIEIRRAKQHNLKSLDVNVPLGVLTGVTGVSGSGKSTLVNEVLFKAVANRLHRARQRPGAHTAVLGLDALDKIIQVDQSPIGRTPRSNPATYTGLFDVIRDLFSKTQEARARGYKPGRFVQRQGRAAKSAAATGRSRSRCTSCPTSTCRASSATASATTRKRSTSASRARRR